MVVSPGWSLLVLADAGVPYLKLMDAYESENHRNDHIVLGGVDSAKQKDQVAAQLELLKKWINVAQSNSRATVGKDNALQELKRETMSGRLGRKMEGMRAIIETLPTETALMDQLFGIEEGIRFLV